MLVTKSIANFFQSDKGRDGVLVALGLALASGSFLLGRLSIEADDKKEVSIIGAAQKVAQTEKSEQVSTSSITASIASASKQTGQYVASKSGSAYHFPWCSGARRIKEENKIYFNSKEEAVKAGYHPAANCKGL